MLSARRPRPCMQDAVLRRRVLCVGGGFALAAVLASSPLFATDEVAAALTQQGRNWQQEGNVDRAAEAWGKLLQLEPRNAEALYGLGMAEVLRGHASEAARCLERLRQVPGGGQYAASLAQNMRLHDGGNHQLLVDARAAANAGDTRKALATYRRLFNDGAPPPGDIALEYYWLLGLSPGGSEPAQRALQRLVVQFPKDDRYALALAVLQIQQAATRMDGLRTLMRLSKNPGLANQADEQLRNGLSWMGPTPPADALPLFHSYLAVHPDAAGIRHQLEGGSQQAVAAKTTAGKQATDSLGTRLAEGMHAMDANKNEEAQQIFEEVLKARPNDANATGGMGILALRRGDYRAAKTLLVRATRTAPGWHKALDSANYLELVAQGTATRQSGDRAGAQRLYEKAIAMDGSQPLAFNELADLQADGGRFDVAATIYRKTLARHPQEPDAWRGLVNVLAEAGKLDEAQQLLAHPPAEMQARADEMARLQASYSAGVGRVAALRGDDAAALPAWTEAVRLDPANPWYRLALAQTQMRGGNVEQAYATLDELLKANPGNAEALYALALLDAQRQDWTGALARIEKIPDAQRTQPMLELQHRVHINVVLAHAAQLVAQKRGSEALTLLKSLEVQVGNDAGLIGSLAFSFADAGDAAYGLALIKKQMGGDPASASPGLRLQYAGMLLKAGDDAGFDTVMDSLAKAPLDASLQANYQELLRLQHIRQADAMRDQGDLAGAEKLLLPALTMKPDDSFAIGALARLRLAQNRPVDALAVYTQALQHDPRNLDLLLGAADIASQAKDFANARKFAEQAVAVAPDNGAVLLEAARVERVSEGERRASKLYAMAIAVQQSSGVDSETLDSLKTEQEELMALRAQSAPEVTVGDFQRASDGSAGTSRMRDTEIPLEAVFHLRNERKITVDLTRVQLEAGTLQPDAGNAMPFGTDPLLARMSNPIMAATKPVNFDQRASGTGIDVGYEGGPITADLGLTPRGFLYDTWVGGLHYGGLVSEGGWWYSLGAERRQVTDSVLSWAGTSDVQDTHFEGVDETARWQWGGVVRNGAQISAGRDFSSWSLYLSASHDWFEGHNVASNQRSSLNAGAQFPLLQNGHSLLQVGGAMTVMQYANNQDGFTYGNGGYFSPQNYESLSVPVTWAQRKGALSYRVDASLGVQYVEQGAAKYFPADAALQSEASVLSYEALPLPLNATYAGSHGVGVAYNVTAAIEYKLNGQFTVGASASMNNTSDYSQMRLGFYLRYSAMPKADLLSLPITPFRSPYAR